MSGINYQYELIKLYLAAFIRPPETSGLEYWLYQINSGKPFDNVLETIFSLDIVQAIYPAGLPNQAFVALVYVNVFGKSPDLEGLNYWTKQLELGRSKGGLVMDMINAGLATPDGTLGKAYIVNRMAVAQFAVDQQYAQHAELAPAYLKNIMATVTQDSSTVVTANQALTSGITGIGIGPPLNSLVIPAAADGLSAAEVKAGVSVTVDLKGTNATAKSTLEVLLNRDSFPTPVTKILTDADIKAQKVTLTIPGTENWGADGSKTVSASVKDSSGNAGLPGGDLIVNLKVSAPNTPSHPIYIPAATNGINAAEKASGVLATVDLSDVNVGVGDKVDLMIGGVLFTPAASVVLNADNVAAKSVNILISGAANWGADGQKIITARVTDVAGNVGGNGGALSVNLDTAAPVTYANTLAIPSAVDGINPAEKAANISVVASLAGITLQAGDGIELLIDGKPFANSTAHNISADDIAAKSAILTIAGNDSAWSTVDGDHVISARLIDMAGNVGAPGGKITVTVDSSAPNSQNAVISIPAATNGLSAAELAAGVSVAVSLTGTGAGVGDSISLLLGGQAFPVAVTHLITQAEVSAKLANVTIPANASWGVDGDKLITAMIADKAGNQSGVSNAVNVHVDTTAPAAPVIPVIIPTALNGISALEKSAGVIATVDLTGVTVNAGDKVELLVDGVAFSPAATAILSDASVAANRIDIGISSAANWGADGQKVITARVIDVAGNVGKDGGPLAVQLDTTPPAALSSPLVISTAVGGINPAKLASNIAVLANLGSLNVQAGDGIELLIDGKPFTISTLHIITADEVTTKTANLQITGNDGAWGTTDGDHAITAHLIDVAGNVGPAGGKLTVTVDSSAPNSQNATISIAAATGGLNAAEVAAGVSVAVGLAGTGAAVGDTVNILLSGQAFPKAVTHTITQAELTAKSATVVIPPDANWGGDGGKLISASITDKAGNVGSPGNVLSVLVDTATPLAPSKPVAIPAALNGINAIEKSSGVVATVDLTGVGAGVGDRVEIYLGNATVPLASTILADANISTNSVSITISGAANWGADGQKIIAARVVDVAGNIGAMSAGLMVDLDTTAPGTLSSPLVIASAVGGLNPSKIVSNILAVASLNNVNVQAGDAIELLIDGKPFSNSTLHTITTDDIAAKSVTLVIAGRDSAWGTTDGDHIISARLLDGAGNIGASGGNLSVTVDSTPPNSQNAVISIAAAANGLSAAEIAAGVNVQMNLTGSDAVAGDTINLLLGGQPFPTAVTHIVTAAEISTKTATFTIPASTNWGADGSKLISANISDKAGNIGAQGNVLAVVVDTTAPAVPKPVTVPAAINGINAVEKAAGVITIVDLTGTGASAGDKVEIFIGGTSAAVASAILSDVDIAANNVSVTISGAASWGADGQKLISAHIVDAAGNIGGASAGLAVNLDTTPPGALTNPLIIAAAVGGLNPAELAANLPVIVNLSNVTVQAGDAIELLIDGKPFSNSTVHVITADEVTSKSASLAIAGKDSAWGTVDADHIISARLIDMAGNIGPSSANLTVTVDSSAPNSQNAIITIAAATNGLNAAEVAAGVGVSMTLAGTNAAAGDTINLLLGGLAFSPVISHVITAAEISSKTANFVIPASTSWGGDGNKLISANITDKAGNVGSPGNVLAVTVDTTSPAAPGNPVVIPAALNGINAAEKSAGVQAIVDLTGVGASAGDKLEIFIAGNAVPIASATLLAADILANSASVTISGAASWGADGPKLITARVTDVAGNIGGNSAGLAVDLDTTPPSALTSPLVIPAAVGGINPTEQAANMTVIANLNNTNAQAGDAIELLIDGKPFTNSTFQVLTANDIAAKSVTLAIAGGDSAWGTVDASHIISAHLIDAAGNIGPNGANANVTVDSQPPNSQNAFINIAAALNGLNAMEIAAGVSVAVNLNNTGVAAGDTINLLLGGQAFSPAVTHQVTAAEVTAKAATLLIPSSVNWGPDGIKLISSNMTDKAGNTGNPGNVLSVLVDTTAPLPPDNPVAIPAAVNSINSQEKLAGVAVIVDLTGANASIGDKVEVLMNGASFSTPVLQTLSNSDIVNGVANVLVPSSAGWGTDGTKTISARVIDAAGNIGAGNAGVTVNLDTIASNGPISPLIVPASGGGGISVPERTAGVDVVVNLNGTTVVAGDQVEILVGGASFATPVISTISDVDIANGNITATIDTNAGWGPDGIKLLTARFSDPAGNVGTASGSTSVNLDGTPPNPPGSALQVPAASNGISSNERAAGVAVTVDLNGTGALGGDTISLNIDGIQFVPNITQVITGAQITAHAATLTIPGNVNWGADGNHILTANVTDALGNVGTFGGAITVYLDTTPPSPATNPVTISAAVNSISAAEKSAGVAVIVDLTGSGVVTGDKLELLIGGIPFATPITQTLAANDIANGLANVTIPSSAAWGADGAKAIGVRFIDVAGNVGANSPDLSINLDTTAPAATGSPLIVPANSGGGVTAAEKAAGVLVNVNLAGTNATVGDSVEILLGGLAFTTPVTYILTAPDIISQSANLTIAANSGWGADGNKTLTARVTDIAGNVGNAGGSTTITLLDSIPPNAPIVPLGVAAASNGINSAEKLAGVAVIGSLAGTLGAVGDTANLLIDGNDFTTPVTHVLTQPEITAGFITFTVPSNAGWGAEGSHVLSMKLTDVAGNVGQAGGNYTVFLDTVPPNAPVNAISVPAAGNGINLAEKNAGVAVTVDLTGTGALSGDKVEILLGGSSFTTPIYHVLTNADISAGTAAATIDLNAGWGSDGVKNLAARVIDAAGNLGASGGSLTTTLDTTAPAAQGLPVYTDVNASGTIDAGDTYVFAISEATTKTVTVGNVSVNNSHTLGAGATAVWDAAGTHLTVTLGVGTTTSANDIVTLVGVSDLAGNSLNLAYSI